MYNNPLTLETFIKEFSKIPRERESRQQFRQSRKVIPAQRRGLAKAGDHCGRALGQREPCLVGRTSGKMIRSQRGCRGYIDSFLVLIWADPDSSICFLLERIKWPGALFRSKSKLLKYH